MGVIFVKELKDRSHLREGAEGLLKDHRHTSSSVRPSSSSVLAKGTDIWTNIPCPPPHCKLSKNYSPPFHKYWGIHFLIYKPSK